MGGPPGGGPGGGPKRGSQKGVPKGGPDRAQLGPNGDRHRSCPQTGDGLSSVAKWPGQAAGTLTWLNACSLRCVRVLTMPTLTNACQRLPTSTPVHKHGHVELQSDQTPPMTTP